MIRNYFEKQFKLRYFEMNKFGIASPSTILILLEETAADHCYSIGQSLYQLEKQNIGWVLISGVVKMYRYPSYKEEIKIQTWLSKYSSIKGYRENIIYDEKNNIIGRAKGLWIFFDIKRRRPTQIFDNIKTQWSFCETESIKYDISKKIKPIENPDYELIFKVNRFDTDMNKHVNNIRYLQWVLESIPDEIMDNYYLHLIDGRFIAEAHYGEVIHSLIKKDDHGIAYTHTIKIKGTEKVCATAETVWKKINAQNK